MSRNHNRKLWAGFAILAAGTLFQIIPTSCANYGAAQAVAAFDFCSVFNCTGGTFFNFCEPIRIFSDCPFPITNDQ